MSCALAMPSLLRTSARTLLAPQDGRTSLFPGVKLAGAIVSATLQRQRVPALSR